MIALIVCYYLMGQLVNKLQKSKETLIKVTFPKGSILKVSRIYIRNGQKNFDSMTFFVKFPKDFIPKKLSGRKRFWAKLENCNNIEFEKP